MEKSVGQCEVSGSVTPPCSKSYAQRALAASLLSQGESILGNIELCDDTRHALDVIQSLGARVSWIGEHTLSVSGGLNPLTDIINTGESGLAARLFTPIAALCDRRITIEGKGTMLKRPVGMMIKPLEELGVKVVSDGYLPISVQGPVKGGEILVEGFVSSQFITGLLTALPVAGNDTTVKVDKAQSIPYLAMTVDMASRFGIKIAHNDFNNYYIAGRQKYRAANIDIEGDWSGAAFMLVAGAVAGSVTVENMNPVSLQADTAVTDALSKAGAQVVTTQNHTTAAKHDLAAFEFDATNCPDLFPILSVLAANCSGTSVIKGARRLIHKEVNRAEAILGEFSKIGIKVWMADEDHIKIKGGRIKGGIIDSRGDHRIAMAGAIAGLTAESPVIVHGAETVTKSYPRFWDDLSHICNGRID